MLGKECVLAQCTEVGTAEVNKSCQPWGTSPADRTVVCDGHMPEVRRHGYTVTPLAGRD